MCSKAMVAGGSGAMVGLRTAPYIHQTAGPDGILHVFLVPLYTFLVRRRPSWTGWRSRCFQAPYTKEAAQAPLGWPGRWVWGHGGPEDRAIHPPDRRSAVSIIVTSFPVSGQYNRDQTYRCWTGWRSMCYQAPYTKGAAQAPIGWPGR